MTKGLSSVYQFRKTGSGQFLHPGQVNLSPGLAKIAPWWLARRDSFAAKAPGLMVGVTAPPTLTSPTRCRYRACDTLSEILTTYQDIWRTFHQYAD